MPFPTDCQPDVSTADHPTEAEARLRFAMEAAQACPDADLLAIIAGFLPQEVVDAIQEGAKQQRAQEGPLQEA